jgi:hypothetical protein
MLSHRFPRVRRYTAENFYIQLLERPDLAKDEIDAQRCGKLLLEAPWDADLNARQISELAASVAAGLGLDVATNTFVEEGQPKVAKPLHDEFATYAALVNSHI